MKRPYAAAAAVAAIAASIVAVSARSVFDEAEPAPPRADGSIVFSVFSGLPAFEGNEACEGLYTVDPSGRGLRRLTSPSPPDYEGQYYPVPAPDGKRLAFTTSDNSARTDEGSYDVGLHVWFLDVRSGAVSRQTSLVTSIFANPFVIWRSDSRFVVPRGSRRVVYEERHTGGGVEGRYPGLGLWPEWSPDGELVAFTDIDARPQEIRIANSDGSGGRKLGAGVRARWSPDGRRLAALSEYSDMADLIILDRDGRRETVAQHVQEYLWSPSGDRLLFGVRGPRRNFGEADIVVLDIESGEREIVGRSMHPLAWAPSGKSILAARRIEGQEAFGVYRIDLDSRAEQLLAVTDDEDLNIRSLPVWLPAGPVTAANGPMAPKPQWNFCLRQLESLIGRVRRS